VGLQPAAPSCMAQPCCLHKQSNNHCNHGNSTAPQLRGNSSATSQHYCPCCIPA
jgi:hypothetical protein